MSVRDAGPATCLVPLAGAGLLVAALQLTPASLRAQQVVTNTAAATYQTPVGTDSVASNPVQTAVLRPQASLQKTVTGVLSARVGEPVQYRLVYGNASSSAPINGAVLVDSLPDGLAFVSAQPAATVSGRVLQWTLGDLPPGSSSQIDLTLTVASGVQDTLRVRNSAYLSSVNAASTVSLAEEVALIGPPSRGLALTHSAELLEVGLGETAPFTLVLQNTGSQPLSDLVVHDLLPDGARYAAGTATGVDSARAAGRNLVFYLAGPLAPGAKASVHYSMAIVSAAAPTLKSTAYGTADAAQVRSPDAVAFLRMRTGFSMEDRAVIGKVWVDQNDNGIQDAGEPGVEGAEIWTDDGEITTTDAEGRFSYRNLRPGHHGFRLDPASLPAAYEPARPGASQDLVTRDASGWTTPRVDFRLVSREGRLSSVRLPIAWSVAAYPEVIRPQSPTVTSLPPQLSESFHTELMVGGSRDTSRGLSAGFEPPPAAAAPARPLLRYEAGIRNRYAVPLDSLALRFPAALDSLLVLSGDSVLVRGSDSTMRLPSVPAGVALRILAWGERQGDSAAVTLERNGRVLDQASVPVADSGSMVERTVAPEFSTDSLPDPVTVPAGGEVAITVDPPPTGWPGEASFPLPAGWEVVPDSGGNVPTPSLGQDRSGSPVLFWRFGVPRRTPLALRLRPTGASRAVEPVRLPALRTPESRAAEQQREFLDGPGVTISNLSDGQVLPIDRVYIAVRGEPGAPVALYDGDSLIEKTSLRIDGVHDFIAVALEPGPHRLRAWMQNSASGERWDSIAVHVTGQPAAFVAQPQHVTLAADGNTVETVRVRVLDRWGVPVTNRPEITVAASGAEPVNRDANPSSLGTQVAPDEAGWLSIRLRAGHTVMRGTLRLSWAHLSQELSFDVLPASQPLLLTGVGRVGVGSSPDAFGALTARGRLDQRTSVVVSYDSRRLNAGRDAFGRTADPLEEAQYPILGDASAQRSTSASRYQLAARVERGFDWLALGDISTTGFGSGLQLSGYRRALPGLAARITTGAVVWQGFGSSTTQALQQLQVRGAGISGPYRFGRNIRGGTEQVVLETRAAENAARVLSRQVLERYVDYQIDYAAGSLLFKQPVPATDGYGNPVFIVVLYESESGGPKSAVWGVRGSVDGNRWLRTSLMDSVRMGATWVHESREAGGHQLLGADLKLLRVGRLELAGETSWSRSRDSSGVAAAVNGAVTMLDGAARLSAAWMTAGREFGNPANVALQGGTQEVRLGGELKQGTRQLELAHEWQRFGSLGLERRHTTGTIVQTIGPKVQVQATMAGDRFTGASSPTNSLGGELRLQWKPESRWTLFTEGRHEFSADRTGLRPDYVGVGAKLDVSPNIALDLRRRQVFLPGDSGGYSVTDFGVRTRVGSGTEAYGKYQIAGVEGGHNAALVGLRNHLMLGNAWALNAQFERRSGLGRASVFDPVRALPFIQTEEDYWSVGLGAEFLRPGSPLRLGTRAEFRDGDIRSTRLVTVAGDVSLNRSLAVLSRQELLRTDQNGAGIATRGHRYSTLWGLAFRPVHSDAINILGKVEWIDADNGNSGGVLTGSRTEGRTILASEAIWQPQSGAEVALRYAFRRSTGSLVASDGATLPLRSIADFVGWRGSLRLRPFLELRADGRFLNERASGTSRYDLAPEVAFLPQPVLEIVAGYRLGDLRDPDFAVNGGHGLFLTFGARLTEGTVASAAEFWRQRLGGQ